MKSKSITVPKARPRRRAAFGLLAFSFGLLSLMVLSFVAASRSGTFGSVMMSRLMLGLRSGTIETPVRLSSEPAIWLDKAKISVRRPSSERPAETASTLPSLSKHKFPVISAERIILDHPAFTVRLDGRLLETGEKPDARLIAFLVEPLRQLRFNRVSIRSGTLTLIRPDGTRELLADINAELHASPARAVTAFHGTFFWRGERIALEATLGPPQALVSPASANSNPVAGKSLPLRLSLSSAPLEFVLEGAIDVSHGHALRGKADLSGTNLRNVARWLSLRLPEGAGLTAFRVRGDLDWRKEGVNFTNAAVTLDGNSATGSLTLTLPQDRPKIAGTLAFKSLDLAPYLGPKSFVSLSDLAASLSVPALSAFEADIRVSAPSITGTALNIESTAVSIAVRGGRLSADLAEVALEQGIASGRIFIDGSGVSTRLGLRLKLEQVSLTRLAALAVSQPTIEGRGDVVLDLTAEGQTVGAALKALNGEARIRAQNGGRIWIPLKQLAADVEAARSLAWKDATRGDTSFEELRADFAVRDGRLLTETVVAKSRGLAVMMDGIINLGVQRIYARLHIDRDGGGFPFLRQGRQQHRLVLVGDLMGPSIALEADDERLAQPPQETMKATAPKPSDTLPAVKTKSD